LRSPVFLEAALPASLHVPWRCGRPAAAKHTGWPRRITSGPDDVARDERGRAARRSGRPRGAPSTGCRAPVELREQPSTSDGCGSRARAGARACPHDGRGGAVVGSVSGVRRAASTSRPRATSRAPQLHLLGRGPLGRLPASFTYTTSRPAATANMRKQASCSSSGTPRRYCWGSSRRSAHDRQPRAARARGARQDARGLEQDAGACSWRRASQEARKSACAQRLSRRSRRSRLQRGAALGERRPPSASSARARRGLSRGGAYRRDRRGYGNSATRDETLRLVRKVEAAVGGQPPRRAKSCPAAACTPSPREKETKSAENVAGQGPQLRPGAT